MAKYDQEIDYWASLCEDASIVEARKRDKEELAEKSQALNESLDMPYVYDTIDEAPVETVKQLKDILRLHFNDNDKIMILGANDEQLEVKAIWNSSAEREVSGIDDANVCYIRIN